MWQDTLLVFKRGGELCTAIMKAADGEAIIKRKVQLSIRIICMVTIPDASGFKHYGISSSKLFIEKYNHINEMVYPRSIFICS